MDNTEFLNYLCVMSTVSIICDTLGRREIAAAVGIKPAAVSNAVFQGRFPAKWFIVVSQMCEAANVACPSEIFAFAQSVDKEDEPHDEQRGAA